MAFSLAIGIASAAETTLSRMILVQDEQSTKAYIELSGQTQFKAFSLQNPNRAVLDIDSAVLGPGFKLPGANGIVLSVRQGKTPTGIRLVFDLAKNGELTAKLDTGSGKTKLVIDLNDAKAPSVAIASHSNSPAPAKPPLPLPTITPDASASVRSMPTAASASAEANNPPVQATVSKQPPLPIPERSAVGYALMDDEIVQIDIDSTGSAPKTTVKPSSEKAPVPAPASKPALKPSSTVQALPKKAKTMNDVLGPSARKMVIAIDAGHGGKDPGAIGPSGVREKDVTLRVAKDLADAINADPGMRAVLIRSDDQFVVLQERYMRARRAQADMFISIHADAAQNNAASGSSVYVLSTKGVSSQAARWLADKENAADLIGEGGKRVSLDDKEPNLSFTLLDLTQNAIFRMSEDAAGNVLQSLKDLGKAHKKQVEYANFVVLRSPDVPSMLVETGFITNADEERKLNDPQHRKRLAFAIANGIRSYFVEQPLQGTYYARSPSSIGSAGVNAASGSVFP